jgi:glycosyltransferase involved in cell wall biosynthesis
VLPASLYQASGDGILWYHYSIYSPNLEAAAGSPDYTIMDYHGVTPPHLFAGQEPHLASLCQQALDLLPTLTASFDQCVVHSEYSRRQLEESGYDPQLIHKLPLVVDMDRFQDGAEPELAASLGQLEYLFFIGRLVPQKDILAMLEIFARLRKRWPNLALILAGSRQLASNYQRQIDRFIRENDMESRVIFAGQVNNPGVLAALFANARFLLVTSEWESFCVPLVEAMYFGTPAVVHDLPPLPEVAGEGGVVIDKTRPGQAADTIHNLLEDRKAYDNLKQEARVRAAHFTDSALAATMRRLLQEVFAVHA